MCGRYKLITEYKKIVKRYPLYAEELWEEFYRIHREINRVEIFPGELVLAINNKYEPEMDWWTIRAETWDGKIANAINAKAETVNKVQMFREAFQKDRVLIPATSLFEWQLQNDGTKKKYEIWFDEPIFSFGGIARHCEIKGELKRCTAIITTSPNETFKLIHNTKQRQAVVIREADQEAWLDPNAKESDVMALMKPLPDSETHFKEFEEEKAQGSLF